MFGISEVFTSDMTEEIIVVRDDSTQVLDDGEYVTVANVTNTTTTGTVTPTRDREISFLPASTSMTEYITIHTTYPLRMASQRTSTLADVVTYKELPYEIIKISDRQSSGYTRAIGVYTYA